MEFGWEGGGGGWRAREWGGDCEGVAVCTNEQTLTEKRGRERGGKSVTVEKGRGKGKEKGKGKTSTHMPPNLPNTLLTSLSGTPTGNPLTYNLGTLGSGLAGTGMGVGFGFGWETLREG